MKAGTARDATTFSCHACAYASPLPPPFEDWIWCGHPGNGRPLNLSRDADCRHAGGGRRREAGTEQAPEATAGGTA